MLNNVYDEIPYPFQGLTLSIWFTWPAGMYFWKLTCPAKIFHVPRQYLSKPCKAHVYCCENKYMPWLKVTCPVGPITTKVYVPWDKIYMPRACGHALMSSPAFSNFNSCTVEVWEWISYHTLWWMWLLTHAGIKPLADSKIRKTQECYQLLICVF